MTNHGNMYGPSFTFLGIPACDLDDPATYKGADVIILGEIPLSLILASEGISRIDDSPIMDSLAVTLKMSELMVDLKNLTGLTPSRRGWSQASPSKDRMKAVLDFYGMGRFIS